MPAKKEQNKHTAIPLTQMTHFVLMVTTKHSAGMQICLQLLTLSTDLQLYLNPPDLIVTCHPSPPFSSYSISLPVLTAGECTRLLHTGPNYNTMAVHFSSHILRGCGRRLHSEGRHDNFLFVRRVSHSACRWERMLLGVRRGN